MPISNDEILHLASLARLKLSPHEVTKLSTELTLLLDYFDQLSSVDTSSVKDLNRLNDGNTIMREDKVKPSLDRSKALASAPETDGEFFHVPRVIG